MSTIQSVEESVGQVTKSSLIDMVFPGQTNHRGTVFDGQAWAQMDKAAFVVTSRYSRRNVVTARAERTEVAVAILTDQLVEVEATVVETGRSSMKVEICLYAEDLLTGDRHLGTKGRFCDRRTGCERPLHHGPATRPMIPMFENLWSFRRVFFGGRT